MGGGGKSGGSTTVQSTPAKYIMPYLTGESGKSGKGGSSSGTTGVLPEAEKQYRERTAGYQPYGGDLVANFGQDTQDYFSGVRGLTAGTGATSEAMAGTKAAGQNYTGGQYDPTKFTGNVVTGEDISRYMNPYTEDVIKRQMASMALQRDEAAAALRGNQAAAGALGGSRAAVESVLANQKYNQLMADTESKLRMEGYDQATATALAQQTALNQAARDTEQSKQFATEDEAARAKFGLTQAAQLADLGQIERAQELERLNALKGIGTMQTAEQQAELDAAYKQFLEGRDWNANELARYAQLIYGAPQGQTQTSSQSMSPWSNVLGAGLFAAGLPTTGGGSLLGKMFGFKDGGVMDIERMMKGDE